MKTKVTFASIFLILLLGVSIVYAETHTVLDEFTLELPLNWREANQEEFATFSKKQKIPVLFTAVERNTELSSLKSLIFVKLDLAPKEDLAAIVEKTATVYSSYPATVGKLSSELIMINNRQWGKIEVEMKANNQNQNNSLSQYMTVKNKKIYLFTFNSVNIDIIQSRLDFKNISESIVFLN